MSTRAPFRPGAGLKKQRGAAVSGPDIDRDGYPTAGAALSAAQTFACRPGEPRTYYVRDESGRVLYRVEKIDARNVTTTTTTTTKGDPTR